MRAPWLVAWSAVFAVVLAWSAVGPHDYLTWWLESTPALVCALVLLLTRRRFPLTPLAYLLLLAHCAILFVGGHYTYAEVPAFDRIRDLLGSERNDYDKLGHFAQGFVPALVAREILVRNRVISGRAWLAFLVTCFALALSALYELIEWGAAVALGSGADDFLGTQGYVWDTQSDMGCALLGALCALSLLSRIHDRQISALAARAEHPASPAAVGSARAAP
jgi:putative membrane protein